MVFLAIDILSLLFISMMLRYVILSFVNSDPLLDGIGFVQGRIRFLSNLHYQKVLISHLSEYYGVIKLSGAS